MVSLAALLVGGLLLSGCGQKGPLYLPPSGKATPVVAPVVTPGAVVAPTTQPELVVPR
jgi:predicted small lipoprotein YifL